MKKPAFVFRRKHSTCSTAPTIRQSTTKLDRPMPGLLTFTEARRSCRASRWDIRLIIQSGKSNLARGSVSEELSMFERAQATQDERETVSACTNGRWISWRGGLRLALALLLAISAPMYGQNVRKLKSSAPPEYPDLAKRMNIRGMARVELTIAA